MAVSGGDIVRVAVNYTMPEQVDAFNVLGFQCNSGTSTDAQFITAMATFLTAAFATLQTSIHDQVGIAEGIISKVTWTGTEWLVTESIGSCFPTFTPSNVNDMLPHAVSPYVTFPTATPQRKGKIKLTGFAEDMQADSLMSGPAATAMANFATAMRTVLTPGTSAVSYAILGDDGVARAVVGSLVRGIVGSQKQRRPGVGI